MRSYYDEYPNTLDEKGARRLRHKILKFWMDKGEKRVEVRVVRVDTPYEHYAVRSNIAELGLLGSGVQRY